MGIKAFGFIKNYLPRGLFARSFLIIVVPVLLIQIVSTVIFFDRHWSKITNRLADAVAGEVVVMAHAFEDVRDPDVLDGLKLYATQSLDMFVTFDEGATLTGQVFEAEGILQRIVARRLNDRLAEKLRRPYLLKVVHDSDYVTIRVAIDNGVLNVICSNRRLSSSTSHIFLLWNFAASGILILVAVIFMRNQIRPIRRLAIAAQRFGKGRSVVNFRPEGAREVRQAGQAFLDMRERIIRQVEQRTTMLAGISHDLRTPLTRMKLALSLLPASPDVDALQGDIDDMRTMVDTYLDYLRSNAEQGHEELVLNGVVEQAVQAISHTDLVVKIDMPADIVMDGQAQALARCLTNILSNASRFAKAALIEVRRHGDTVVITVDDDGPGIAEEKRADALRPFVRLDDARGKSTGGVGLGLSICLDIVAAHGGTLALETARPPYGGLRVVMILPQ